MVTVLRWIQLIRLVCLPLIMLPVGLGLPGKIGLQASNHYRESQALTCL